MKKWMTLAVLAAACGANAQLVVDNTQTPLDLVQNVLLGGGVTVSNVTFNGLPGTTANEQIGSFNGTASNVGIASGIILASGDVNGAIGPNAAGGFALGGGFWSQGDADLLQLAADSIRDAAVLEFDFIPSGDSLSFKFVFGSDEYLEFVDAFNDAFGFFLSGPGISGPYTGGAINIALVPGTSIPVTINNVNNVDNLAWYVDNGDGSTAPYNSDPIYIQYDGFTQVMTATAIVQCGQTYHIKIAIGDAIDTAWDSGVFLEAGSFSSPNQIQLEVVTASADGTLTEGCTDAIFTISRPGSEDSIEVSVVVAGTAINGTDYTSLPLVITLPADSTSVSFPVSAFEDGLPEGTETITLTATFVNACGDTSVSSATVPIVDYVPMVLSTSDTLTNCVPELVPISAWVSGGFESVILTWEDGTTGSTLMVPGDADGTYTVTASDECEKSISAEVFVQSGCDIIIPNVFSPNHDGENDYFVIQGILGTTNKVRIFNRWGQIVFEASNYNNNWDAREVSDGTYYYEVTVGGEAESPYTGHLTILDTGN